MKTTEQYFSNIWKILYLNCGERYEGVIDHSSYTHNLSSCEIKAWKNSGLDGVRTHDLCDAGAVQWCLDIPMKHCLPC